MHGKIRNELPVSIYCLFWNGHKKIMKMKHFNRLKTVSALNYVSDNICLWSSLIRDVIETKNFTALKQDYCYFLRQWNFWNCSEERAKLPSQGIAGCSLGSPGMCWSPSVAPSLPSGVTEGGRGSAVVERLGLWLMKGEPPHEWLYLRRWDTRLGWQRDSSRYKGIKQTSLQCVSEQVPEGCVNEKKDK